MVQLLSLVRVILSQQVMVGCSTALDALGKELRKLYQHQECVDTCKGFKSQLLQVLAECCVSIGPAQ
jgi:hypothetical protein